MDHDADDGLDQDYVAPNRHPHNQTMDLIDDDELHQEEDYEDRIGDENQSFDDMAEHERSQNQ